MPIVLNRSPYKRRCSPTCSNMRPCDVHGQRDRQWDKQRDRERGTANERGYGWRWQQYRKVFLSEHPLCERCKSQGRIKAADMVDHRIPVQSANDPGFWEPSNHQALCSEPCHRLKTAEDIRKGLTR